MNQQGTIDWTIPERHHENRVSNQEHYEQNADRFNRQCKKVYDLLCSGVRLTVSVALNKHGIGHLPRRIADLKAKGVEVKSEWMEVETMDGKTKVKSYYL